MPGGVPAGSQLSDLVRSLILSDAIRRREASAGETTHKDSGLDFVR